MNEEIVQGNPSEDSVPGEGNVASSEGQENAADNSVTTLAEMMKGATGRDFESDEKALESLKETYEYVGKAGRAEKELTELKASIGATKEDGLAEKVAGLEQTIKNDKFYSENAQYSDYRGIIEALGTDPTEVINNEAFKNVYEKAVAGDEAQKANSVLQSNPRLGAASDKLGKAQENLAEGNDVAAHDNAVGAVIDAFGMEK